MLAERKQVPASVLDEVARAPLSASTNGGCTSDAVSPYALLLALMYLGAPLADLAPIVRAVDGHEALGRQLAEARGAFALEMQHAQQHGQTEQHSVPSLDVVVAHIAAIIRHSSDLPTLLKHELSRVEAELMHAASNSPSLTIESTTYETHCFVSALLIARPDPAWL